MMKVLIILLLLSIVSCKVSSNSESPNYDTETLGIEWIDIPAGEFQIGENFNVAFAAVVDHKLRSFLTMLGIIFGVASVIAMLSFRI